jgi:hypothetical protein
MFREIRRSIFQGGWCGATLNTGNGSDGMTISYDELAALTAEFVAIDSTNPDLVPGGAGEAEIARFVAGWRALSSTPSCASSTPAAPM